MVTVCLEIEYASRFALAVATALALPRLAWIRIGIRFSGRFFLLAIALGTYYWIAVEHGLFRPTDAVALAGMALAGYLAGFTFAASKSDESALAGTVAGVVGGVVFGWLCIQTAVIFDAGKRFVLSPWDGFPFSAPGLGAFGSMAMALLPAALFGARDPGRYRGLSAISVLLLVGTGLYVNLLLQNRTPFLALAASMAVGAFLFVRSAAIPRHKKLGRFLLLAIPALVAALAFPVMDWVGGLEIWQRFDTEGLATARYELWWEVLTHIFEYPGGGRMIRIPEYYAHNLWLDVAWDSGPLPFVLLLAFHVSHLGLILRFMSSHKSVWAKLVVMGLGMSLLFTCMAEPVLHMQPSYFILSCYYFGMVLGVTVPPARGAPSLVRSSLPLAATPPAAEQRRIQRLLHAGGRIPEHAVSKRDNIVDCTGATRDRPQLAPIRDPVLRSLPGVDEEAAEERCDDR